MEAITGAADELYRQFALGPLIQRVTVAPAIGGDGQRGESLRLAESAHGEEQPAVGKAQAVNLAVVDPVAACERLYIRPLRRSENVSAP